MGKDYEVTIVAPDGNVANTVVTAEEWEIDAGVYGPHFSVPQTSVAGLDVTYFPDENRLDIAIIGSGGQYTVTIATETIHTMAPEFLPAGVGGNDRDFIIDATRGADDTISSKTTFDEVVAAVKSRKVPVLYCDGPDGYLLKNTSHLVYAEGTTVNAVTFQFEHASAGFVIVVEPSGWFIG